MKAKQARNETEKASLIEQIQTEIIDKQLQNEENEIDKKALEDILKKYGEVKKDEEGNITGIKPEGKTEISIEDIMGNNKVTEAEKPPVISDVSGANEPSGQIANKEYVTWEWNTTTNEYDEILSPTQPDDWYDYENGKWANIKTTKVNTNEDGTKETLEAYWVWIPRYEYVVPTSETATQIEVKFIGKDKITPDKNYVIHPAFTNEGNGGFGELDGIWVAKFEATRNKTGDSNNPNLKVQVIPNKSSWKFLETKNIFKVCRKMTNEGEVLEGSTVDSHMMKNTEWGAVAILSQSKYGVYNPESINGEKGNREYQIWNNPAPSGTGKVGNSKDDYRNSSVNAYNSINGPKASTTGTVYGIYDMAGGMWEFVAGVLKGNSTDLEYANSKFDIANQVKPDGMSDLDFAKKYLDLYDYRTSDSECSQYIIGDCTVETKGWNEDYSRFIYVGNSIFLRGRLSAAKYYYRYICIFGWGGQ